MDTTTQQRIETLERAAEIMLGRLNALSSLIVVMASHLPPEIAGSCAAAARITLSHIEADLLASLQSDTTATEMQRVFSEGIRVFEMAARPRGNEK